MTATEPKTESMVAEIPKVSPQDTVDFIRNDRSNHLIVVDFDETLLIRNSTEEYLNAIAPRTIGAIVLTLLDSIRPWNWFSGAIGGPENRDWFRVVILTLLFPWNLLWWNKQARRIAEAYANQELIAAIKQRPEPRVIVVTKGFNFIVRPIAKYLPIAIEQTIGCRFWKGYIDRKAPKELLMQGHFSSQEIQQSIFVTDSLDDRSYLAIAEHPFLVQWEGATYIPAMTDAYLPLFYAEKVKRPGRQTIKKLILKNHFIALFLALSWVSPMPIVHGVGILLLTFAFWCIYEVGYYENDRVAEKYEENPTLSETYHRYKSKMNEWEPWIWVMLLSVPGLVLLQLSESLSWSLESWRTLNIANSIQLSTLFAHLGAWLSILGVTRILYVGYNYLDEKTRIWIYPILQYCKYFSFLLVVATSFVGIILMFVQTLIEWVPYIIYRCGGRRDDLQEQLFRVYLFVFLCLAVAVSLRDFSLIATPQFFVILTWAVIRCNKQMRTLWQNAHLLSTLNSGS